MSNTPGPTYVVCSSCKRSVDISECATHEATCTESQRHGQRPWFIEETELRPAEASEFLPSSSAQEPNDFHMSDVDLALSDENTFPSPMQDDVHWEEPFMHNPDSAAAPMAPAEDYSDVLDCGDVLAQETGYVESGEGTCMLLACNTPL